MDFFGDLLAFFFSFSLFVSLTFFVFSFLLHIYLRFLFWPCFFTESSRLFEKKKKKKKKQGQSRFSEPNFSFFSAFESFWCPPSMCLRTDATSVQGHGNGTYKDINMNKRDYEVCSKSHCQQLHKNTLRLL